MIPCGGHPEPLADGAVLGAGQGRQALLEVQQLPGILIQLTHTSKIDPPSDKPAAEQG